MIENLTVKDFALIDSVVIDFQEGFTVLSGETGAGKSILIGSLSFLFGDKGRVDSIRTGAEEARVSGVIYIKPEMLLARSWLEEKGIELDSDRVLIRRTLKQNGRSGMWIQDMPVTRAELSEFTSFLVDIHGQHEHQSLLKVEHHRKFLDAYAEIEDLVKNFTELYSSLASLRKTREEMESSEQERLRKKEILSFAIEEISSSKLQINEEVELDSEEQRLSQFEKLNSFLETINNSFSDSSGVISGLKKIKHALENAAQIDNSLNSVLNRIENTFYELEDVFDTLKNYTETLIYDPARLEQVQERQSVLYRLKKKYGTTISDVLEYEKQSVLQLEQLESWESNKEFLSEQIIALEKKIFEIGIQISTKRKEKAALLQQAVEKILTQLGMPQARFEVAVNDLNQTEKIRNASPYGFDSIEFLISANPGESVKPLAKIASGGEISRVMLALKTVLANIDDIDTLIFDEIDSGIGGEIAQAIGNHLSHLSKIKQVLCITHLASIAAQATSQFKIEKKVLDEKTITKTFEVTGQNRVEEIARMLSGDTYSKASIEHAQELLSKNNNI